jgi:hypothetical protein
MAGDQGAIPARDGVRAHQQSQAAKGWPQPRVQERREQGAVGGLELDPLAVDLELQHGDLVSQREDLDISVAVTAGQQAQ